MSSGGQLPQLPQQSDATGTTGAFPTTSQQMPSMQSPAGGKGGYPAQQQQQMNPFASQYQQPQQMRQIDNGGMGNVYARRRMEGGLQPMQRGQRFSDPFGEGPQPSLTWGVPQPDTQPVNSGAGLAGLMGGMNNGPSPPMGGFRNEVPYGSPYEPPSTEIYPRYQGLRSLPEPELQAYPQARYE